MNEKISCSISIHRPREVIPNRFRSLHIGHPDNSEDNGKANIDCRHILQDSKCHHFHKDCAGTKRLTQINENLFVYLSLLTQHISCTSFAIKRWWAYTKRNCARWRSSQITRTTVQTKIRWTNYNLKLQKLTDSFDQILRLPGVSPDVGTAFASYVGNRQSRSSESNSIRWSQ